MIKKKLLAVSILLFFLIPSVFADWTQDSKDGVWYVRERTHWKSGSGSGTAQWHTSIANFTGYYAKINFSDLYTSRAWWQESAYKNVNIKLKFEGAGSSFWIWLWFDDFQSFWGIYYGRRLHFDAQVNLTDWDNGDWTFWEYTYDLNTTVEFYFVFNETTNHIELYAYDYVPIHPKPVKIEPYPNGWNVSSSWNDDVTVTMIVEHDGPGHFEGYYYDEFKAINSLPESETKPEQDFWSFISFLISAWNTIIPENVRKFLSDLWNSLGFYISVFVGVLSIVWSGVTLSISYFPVIILFWLLDAILTAVQTGNLQPVGNAFITIYNFARAVIQTLVNIMHMIRDLIPFI